MEKEIYVKDFFLGEWEKLYEKSLGTTFYVHEQFPDATTEAQRSWVKKFIESWKVKFFEKSKLILTAVEFLQDEHRGEYFAVRLTIVGQGTLKKGECVSRVEESFFDLIKKELALKVRREYPLSCPVIPFDSNVPVCICLKLWGDKWQEEDLQKFEDISFQEKLQKILAGHKAEFVDFSFLPNTRCVYEVDKNLIMRISFLEEVSRKQIDLLAEDLKKCFVHIKDGKKIEPKFLSLKDYPYVM